MNFSGMGEDGQMTQMNGEEQVSGFARVVSMVLRVRAVALVLFLAATVLLCLQLGKIEMPKDPTESMIPPRHAYVPALRAIEAMSTQPEALIGILEVKKGDIYNKETVKKIEGITRSLMGVEEITPKRFMSLAKGVNNYENTVEGLAGEPILGRVPPETKEDFQAIKSRVATNPLGIGNFVSYDGTATMISAGLTDLDLKAELSYRQLEGTKAAGLSLEQYKKQQMDAFNRRLLKLVADQKAKEDDANHTLFFTGDRLLAAELTTMAKTQVPVAAAAMMVLMLLFLIGYFRSFRGALVPVFAFALSVLWGLGIFGAGRFPLNPMAFLFPLLLGVLSLVCSAMAVKAYDRASAETESKMQAVLAAYRSAPVAGCLLTAGLVGPAMLIAGVPMIRELGWLSLFWAIGTFVVVGLISPVLMSLLPRPGRTEPEQGACNSLAGGVIRTARRIGKGGVSILLAVILVAGALCVWKLKVGDNVPGPSYVRAGDPWNQGFHVLAEKFNGPYLFLVYAKAKKEGGLLQPEAINQMGDFSTYLTSEGIARLSVAFDWVVKLGRIALMDGNPKWWTVPASKKDMEGLSRLLTFSGALDVLVDQSFSEATIASFFPGSGTDEIDAYASAMQRYIDTHPSEYIDFSLGGGLLAKTKAINDGTRDAYRKTLALALVIVFFVGLLVTRSVFPSLIVTLSVAAGQALLLSITTLVGWPASLGAVPAAVAGVGFGAVFGIHLIRAVRGRGGKSADSDGGTANTAEAPAGGIFFLGFLAFAALSPWFFIGMKFQADMALYLGLAVLLQAFSAVVFVPALSGPFSRK